MSQPESAKTIKRRLRLFTEEGLPRDTAEWTVDDWRDLHTAYCEAIRKISERHKEKQDEDGSI
jgi:hypothetical protein